MALYHGLGIVHVMQLPENVAGQLSFPPALQIIIGIFWITLSGIVWVRLVRRQSQGVRFAIWLIVGFLIYSGLRIVLFSQSDYDQQRVPFLLVSVISIIVFVRLLYGRPEGENNEW